MCLMYNEGETNQLLKRFDALPKGKTTLDFWKVYKKYVDTLSCIYQSKDIRKPGCVVSNRKSRKFRILKNKETFLHRGIHVFTNLHGATLYRQSSEIILKVQARKCDLVGAGVGADGTGKQAVFMEITIPQDEWDRVFKNVK